MNRLKENVSALNLLEEKLEGIISNAGQLESTDAIDSASMLLLTSNVRNYYEKAACLLIARSCWEIKATDAIDGIATDGMYFIDPDGPGVIGDDPNSNRLLYSPGCYSKDVTYSDATIRQMVALALMSSQWRQLIKVTG